jgi:hypothetical protein
MPELRVIRKLRRIHEPINYMAIAAHVVVKGDLSGF